MNIDLLILPNKNLDKILCIVSFSLIQFALCILATTSNINGYEISIYKVYPWYFWLSILLSISIGQLILIRTSLFSNKNKYWIYGYTAILLTNAILLFLPLIRGYYTYGRGDPPTHIGIIRDLMETAGIGSNYYPLDHIFATSLSYFLNLNIEKIILITPVIFSIYYMISIYLLMKTTFRNRIFFVFALNLSTILLFGGSELIFVPSFQSFLLLPFTLYLFFKSYSDIYNCVEFRILLFITMACITFFHPVTILFFMAIFMAVLITSITYSNNIQFSQNKNYLSPGFGGLNAIIVSFILFFSWYFSFSSVIGSLKSALSSLLYGSESSNYQMYSSISNQITLPFSKLLEIAYFQFGLIIIMSIIGGIFSIYFIAIILRKKKSLNYSYYHFLYSFCFLLFVLLSIVFFFNDFIIDFWRVYKFAMFFGTIVVGLGLQSFTQKNLVSVHEFVEKIDCMTTFKLLCTYMIILSFVFTSVITFYPSPHARLSNHQISEMEVTGFKWLFDYGDEGYLIQELGTNQNRFHDMLFGVAARKNDIRNENTMIPYHFGYTSNVSLGNYYQNKRYMVIPLQMEYFYQTVFPEYEENWRLLPSDFSLLERDSYVFKIYDNDGLSLYQIE